MALNLPVKMMQAKEQDSVFFIELYKIELPNGELRLCACDQDITFNNELYQAIPLQRDKLTNTVDNKTDGCKLTVSNFDDSFTVALFSGYDFRGCNIAIFQIKYPDSLTDNTLLKPVLGGYLDAPTLDAGKATFSVECKTYSPSLDTARTMQLPCNNIFGDGDCCLAKKDVKTGTLQTGTTQYTLVLQENNVDNYRQFGIISIGAESRKILSSNGNTVTVEYPFSFTPTGTYTIENGCDLTANSCDKYNQRMNYSGFFAIPFEYQIKT